MSHFFIKVQQYATFRIQQFLSFFIQVFFATIGILRSVGSKSNYEIKAGYFPNMKSKHFNDTSNKDEYQNEVYQHAEQLMSKHHLTKVVDVGCGSAFKLLKYMSNYDTTGIDVKDTVEFLKHRYPERNWLETSEIEDPALLTTDLIICADVIEHLHEPMEIITFINKIRAWKFLVISTPDRDLARGSWSYGPPVNKFHVREWNKKEALNFLSKYFDVLESTISNNAQSTHMLVCTKKASTS